jgi:single-stranded-DNA-specific exonuclease
MRVETATSCRWLLPCIEPAVAESLASDLDIFLPAARVLAGRGYTSGATARKFLRPSLEDLHDPMLMLGMREAVERIHRAIAAQEKILLYGDYDVDGATSLVILKKGIEFAGGAAATYVPNRLRDGYGMRPEAIEQFAAEGYTLVVSVDTGIRAAEFVCRARQLGIDVIVTDHHLPDATIPPALAVLNPKQPGCSYPDKNLCGVGVAFKLVQALLGSTDLSPARQQALIKSFLKIVAIGTVADVVPLTGENRAFVKFGLDGLADARNPGLRELLRVAGFAKGEAPSSGSVAFRIAPRMNAAGRMADANDVIDLLLTEDEERARQIAGQLNELNLERQNTEQQIVEEILAECDRTPVPPDRVALVFSGRDWHRGVIGIVASRLVERFHRPVFVLSEDPEERIMRGSGRSIPSFHLLDALESMPELLTKFGGHRQAAGLTLASENLEEFRERLNSHAAARLSPEDLLPQVHIDATLSLGEVSDRSVAELLSLAPFGCGNPTPVLAVMAAEVAADPVPWNEKHLRVTVRQDGRTLNLKAWNFGRRVGELACGSRVDVAIAFEEDKYALSRGYPGWCAVLKNVRPAQTEALAATTSNA